MKTKKKLSTSKLIYGKNVLNWFVEGKTIFNEFEKQKTEEKKCCSICYVAILFK